MISILDFKDLNKKFVKNEPFDHVVIDNFWSEDIAKELLSEMSDMPKNKMVTRYLSPLENKIAIPHWDLFKKTTYRAFYYLNSDFIPKLQKISGIDNLIPDIGLHGGGLHFHPTNGILNVHKDYSIHPKLGTMRKLNLIIYMNQEWKEEWNGQLEFWSHDEKNNLPDEKIKSIMPIFNRAVLFDVSQNSWHGLPVHTKQPDHIYRQSMAVYYMIKSTKNAERRPKALFAPRLEQKNDEKIIKFIHERAGLI